MTARRPGRPAGLPSRRGASHAVLLDTGPLVALYERNDSWHAAASQWMAGFDGELHTVPAVLTEAAYSFPARTRAVLADMVGKGTLHLHQPDAAAHMRIATLLRKYADMDPDWADIELVWLAETTGFNRIATLDTADFTTYRIHGRKRFELELLR
jgi:uncharacterized protein